MTTPAPRTRVKWLIAGGVLLVVLAGAWVGTIAGRLAHRAPRATGLRVAVLPVDTAAVEGARGLDRFVAAALEGALARAFVGSEAESHIVPLAVVASKLEVMKRGGMDGTLRDAARVLDVDVVVSGAVTLAGDALKLSLEVGPPGGEGRVIDIQLDGQAPLAQILARLPDVTAAAVGTPLATMGPPTSSARAFGAFSQGLSLIEAGALREAAGRFHDAVDEDASFADARLWHALSLWLVRDRTVDEEAALSVAIATAHTQRAAMGPVEQLVSDAAAAWMAWQAASSDDKARRGEDVFTALRTLTVKHPEERIGHLLLGRAYVQVMNGATEALRHFESARRLAPTWFPTVAELVDAWLKMGDRKHATAEIRGYLVYRKDDATARALLQAIGE